MYSSEFLRILIPPNTLVQRDLLFCASVPICRQDYGCKGTSYENFPLLLRNYSMYFGNWINQSKRRELLFTSKIVYSLDAFSFRRTSEVGTNQTYFQKIFKIATSSLMFLFPHFCLISLNVFALVNRALVFIVFRSQKTFYLSLMLLCKNESHNHFLYALL